MAFIGMSLNAHDAGRCPFSVLRCSVLDFRRQVLQYRFLSVSEHTSFDSRPDDQVTRPKVLEIHPTTGIVHGEDKKRDSNKARVLVRHEGCSKTARRTYGAEDIGS